MSEQNKPAFGGFTRPLDDLQRAKIKKTLQRAMSEKDLMLECAKDFGFLIADAEKNGLSIPVAYEAAKNHFRVYGKAMMEFADVVTMEMMPAGKK